MLRPTYLLTYLSCPGSGCFVCGSGRLVYGSAVGGSESGGGAWSRVEVEARFALLRK